MVAIRQTGQLQGQEPRFTADGFEQSFIFRTNVVIAKNAMPQLLPAVLDLFKKTLIANKVEHYLWPPHRVEITPHNDFKGFEATLETKARSPGVTVLHRFNQ